MSPRSVEFMDQARDRAVIARVLLAAGHPEGAVSAAYYAMLYAAQRATMTLHTRRGYTPPPGAWEPESA